MNFKVIDNLFNIGMSKGYKVIRYLVLGLIVILGNNVFAFGGKTVFKAKNRTKVCSPVNSLTSGFQVSNNFGKTYGACSGFSCQPNYTVSGGSCVLALVPNATCWYTSTSYGSETPFCGPYTTSVSAISLFSTVSIFGYSEWSTTFPYKLHFNCPSLSVSSTWVYNETLAAMFGSDQLTSPTNYSLYAHIVNGSKSGVRLEWASKKLYAIDTSGNSVYVSGICTQL